MKTIIAGCRWFTNWAVFKCALDNLVADEGLAITEVVSGHAPGVDAMGERWAAEADLPIKKYPADWEFHGRAAGPIRNRQMAEYADLLIAFWDNRTRGTQDMIHRMRQIRKPLHVLLISDYLVPTVEI